MYVEVVDQNYLFWRKPREPMKIRDAQRRFKHALDNKESLPPSRPPFRQPTARTAPKPEPLKYMTPLVFRHNPLHDMESVVWLAFYLTVFCEVAYPDDVTPIVKRIRNTALKALGQKLFDDRYRVFTASLHLRKIIPNDLDPRFHPILEQLMALTDLLVDFHRSAEQNLHEPPHEPHYTEEALTTLYMEMKENLAGIAAMLKDDDITLVVDCDSHEDGPSQIKRIIKQDRVLEKTSEGDIAEAENM